MDAVKLVDVEKGFIEGWAIPFGGPMPGGKDFDGEAFTPETELYLGNHETRPLKYHHGKDVTIGHHKIGMDTKATRKERGIWLEAQIDMGHQYAEVLKELLGEGWLGFSSGAMPSTVSKTADGMITSWEWYETSLTPTPANPFSMITAKSADADDPWVAIATKSGRRPALQLVEYAALRSHLGHLPDAGEVAVWMAEKTHENNKPDAAFERRLAALEADVRQREQAGNDAIRRETKRIKEALDVAS